MGQSTMTILYIVFLSELFLGCSYSQSYSGSDNCEMTAWVDTYNCEKKEDIHSEFGHILKKEAGSGYICMKNQMTKMDGLLTKEDVKAYEEILMNPEYKPNNLPADILSKYRWIDIDDFNTDKDRYMRLNRKKAKREVKGPIIDPIFGGTPCIIELNGVKLIVTRNHKKAEEYQDKYTNIDFEKKTKEYACDIPICPPKEIRPPVTGVIITNYTCQRYRWTGWGSWSGCDHKCGEKGRVTRTRKCTLCGIEGEDNKNPPKDQCLPMVTFDGSKGQTREDYRACSPCPSSNLVSWADWEPWSAPDKTCGEVTIYRIQKCNADYASALAKEGNKERCDTDGKKGGVRREEQWLYLEPCRG